MLEFCLSRSPTEAPSVAFRANERSALAAQSVKQSGKVGFRVIIVHCKIKVGEVELALDLAGLVYSLEGNEPVKKFNQWLFVGKLPV